MTLLLVVWGTDSQGSSAQRQDHSTPASREKYASLPHVRLGRLTHANISEVNHFRIAARVSPAPAGHRAPCR